MLNNHKLIYGFEREVIFLSTLYRFLNFFSLNEIRVLVYHHIEKEEFDLFYKQLILIKKNWNFITPDQFEDHIKGIHKLKGKNVLLTFDDGFYSNYIVCKKILEKLKIKAIFFIPSDFAKINLQSKAKKFIKKNILDQDLPKDFKNSKNMTFKNLKYLIKKGHKIGAHTKTHINLGLTKNIKVLKDEIISSKIDMERKLNITIKHFAFTYGNYTSISKISLKLALSQYEFIYSCLRGNNYRNQINQIIKRDAIYLKKGNKLLLIFLSGLIDIKYFFQILNINKLIKKLIKKF